MNHFSLLLTLMQCMALFANAITQWTHSELGAALLIPLSLSSPLDLYHHRPLSTLNKKNVRTKLSDGLARHGSYYTTTVYIGSPPQAFSLIVDTGSSITYVPCSSCSHCGAHQDPRFKAEESSSFVAMQCEDGGCEMGSCVRSSNHCTYARHYAEQSVSSGYLGRDYMRYGKSNETGYSARPLVFGCETYESGELYWQHADGIMGLGRGSVSVLDQMIVQGAGAVASTFSLCYGGMDDEDGGVMVLGALPPMDEMVFTPSNSSRSSYYNVVLKEIWVQGQPLAVEPHTFDGRYGTILDSGTTFAYLPEHAFHVFKDAFVRALKNLEVIDGPDENFKDLCYSGAGTNLDNVSSFFPSIDLVFGNNKMVSLAAENYLFRHTTHAGAYCLGVFQNEDSTTILGGIVTRNMLVTYDREHDRIGFLRTKCTHLWRALDNNNKSTTFNNIPPPDDDVDVDHTDNINTGPSWTIPPPSPPLGSSFHPQAPPATPPPIFSVKKQKNNHSDGIPLKDVYGSHASSSSLLSLLSLRHLLSVLPIILVLLDQAFESILG